MDHLLIKTNTSKIKISFQNKIHHIYHHLIEIVKVEMNQTVIYQLFNKNNNMVKML